MSASYFDLLKYAATGIASPSMTYYDRMRARTLMGGATVQTLTGQPPLTFKADGSPLISWSMKGNGSQTGTPSPQNIIMPTLCGLRTANLVPAIRSANGWVIGYRNSSNGSYSSNNWNGEWLSPKIPLTAGEKITISAPQTQGASMSVYFWNGSTYLTHDSDTNYSGSTFTAPEGTTQIDFAIRAGVDNRTEANVIANGFWVMLNSGSTALPYEPFGYKIPISCGWETTPVYLGEVQTVRRVKKLVLTGEESCYQYDFQSTKGVGVLNALDANYTRAAGFCSHYPVSTASELNSLWIGVSNKVLYFIGIMDVLGISSTAAFKSYLAAQYAAGNPVTVWYVLATPATGITNEPLAKIGDYADELSSEDAGVTIPTAKGQNTLTVDTPIQPSEMSITYRG